jgi:hypothetical protein
LGEEGAVNGKRRLAAAVHAGVGWGDGSVECGDMSPLWIRWGAWRDAGWGRDVGGGGAEGWKAAGGCRCPC